MLTQWSGHSDRLLDKDMFWNCFWWSNLFREYLLQPLFHFSEVRSEWLVILELLRFNLSLVHLQGSIAHTGELPETEEATPYLTRQSLSQTVENLKILKIMRLWVYIHYPCENFWWKGFLCRLKTFSIVAQEQLRLIALPSITFIYSLITLFGLYWGSNHWPHVYKASALTSKSLLLPTGKYWKT